MSQNIKRCAILFSGGTDSTCAAALMSEEFNEIHLVTFYERGTRESPFPTGNIERLQKKFSHVRFVRATISTDELVKHLSYKNYLQTILRHGFFALATPGFSSLSWHAHMIDYCRKNEIRFVADGLTRELVHFPGHMTRVITLFRGLYADFGIDYRNPVRDWDVPHDLQFTDRLIVDRHGFFPSQNAQPEFQKKTTGEYLYRIGLFPHPNVKGSEFDRSMQHDCYPFVLYNIFAFWLFLPFHSYEEFERRMERLFVEKCALAKAWLMDAVG